MTMVNNPGNLEFSADLRCEIDSCPLTIRSVGRTFVVEVPDVATGLNLFRLVLPRGFRRRRLLQTKNALDFLHAEVEIRIADRPVFSLGHSHGSRAWHFLGLPALRVRAGNAIAACSARSISK